MLPALLLMAALPPAVHALSRPSQVPTEEEQERNLAGNPDRDGRDYQKRSLRSFSHQVEDSSAWVKQHLGGLQVTWARVLLAAGLLGLYLSRSKNKHIVKYALLFAFGLLATAAGLAGVVLGL